jgi:BirA family transcriptional regulator, biotin operon repressor / biotin---[acetyl-CoA-carboxylase] ligase
VKLLQKYSKNRLIAGTQIIHLEHTRSTSSHLNELLQQKNITEGTVISAGEQTEGRGQMGNKWYSAAGKNLTFSFVLYPQYLMLREQFMLNMAISLAMHDFLKRLVSDCYIKWPNDIYISHKKIAGILVENSITGEQIRQSIAGIGFNVNETDFPPFLPNPTSLSLETGRRYDTEEVLEELLDFLDVRLLQLRSGKHSYLRNAYIEKLYRFEKPYLFEVNKETLEGVIKGVDEEGRLLVEIENSLRSFSFKEIKYLYEIWN